MEIIKPGNLDKKDGVITFTCPNCDCVFTAKSGEYKHESYQWDCSDFYRVRCPFCGQSITEDAALVYISNKVRVFRNFPDTGRPMG